MGIFIPFAVFSILLFALILLKRTFVAQLLSPGTHTIPGVYEPLTTLANSWMTVEKWEDMRSWMAPY